MILKSINDQFIYNFNILKISGMDVPINYHKNRLYTIKSLLTSLGLFMFTLTISKYLAPNSAKFFSFMATFILNGGLIITNFTTTIFLKVHQMLLLSVRMRYTLINRILKKNFLSDRIQIHIIIQSKNYDLNSLIERVAGIHDELGEIVDKINFCYSFQVSSNRSLIIYLFT